MSSYRWSHMWLSLYPGHVVNACEVSESINWSPPRQWDVRHKLEDVENIQFTAPLPNWSIIWLPQLQTQLSLVFRTGHWAGKKCSARRCCWLQQGAASSVARQWWRRAPELARRWGEGRSECGNVSSDPRMSIHGPRRRTLSRLGLSFRGGRLQHGCLLDRERQRRPSPPPVTEPPHNMLKTASQEPSIFSITKQRCARMVTSS